MANTSSVHKVSHTLANDVYERLSEIAHRGKVSESSVIEHALNELFKRGNDEKVGKIVRDAGGSQRRKF